MQRVPLNEQAKNFATIQSEGEKRERENTRNRRSGTIPRRSEGTAVENTWLGIERDTPVAIT